MGWALWSRPGLPWMRMLAVVRISVLSAKDICYQACTLALKQCIGKQSCAGTVQEVGRQCISTV